MAKKYTNIGVVRKSSDPKKSQNAFISLGNPASKNKKYQRHVEIRVLDADGNQIAFARDPMLTLQDPRTNPNKTEEQKASIPDWLFKEIVLVENQE